MLNEIPVDQAPLRAVLLTVGPKLDFKGRPRTRVDGTPLATVELVVQTQSGADVLAVTVPAVGVAKELPQYAPVFLDGLLARYWEMEGRHGIAFSAERVVAAK